MLTGDGDRRGLTCPSGLFCGSGFLEGQLTALGSAGAGSQRVWKKWGGPSLQNTESGNPGMPLGERGGICGASLRQVVKRKATLRSESIQL